MDRGGKLFYLLRARQIIVTEEIESLGQRPLTFHKQF